MHDGMGTVARQPFGDGLADSAAGAGDEGAPPRWLRSFTRRGSEHDREPPGGDLAASCSTRKA